MRYSKKRRNVEEKKKENHSFKEEWKYFPFAPLRTYLKFMEISKKIKKEISEKLWKSCFNCYLSDGKVID